MYDRAYVAMTKENEPGAFREFLLRAPSMFYSLGERLSGIEHVTSFWRYRFPLGQLQRAPVDELVDIFMDFEQSLNSSVTQAI